MKGFRRGISNILKSIVVVGLVGVFLAACSSVQIPEEELEPQAWLRTHVDIDAVGLNTGRSWVNAFTSLQDALDCVRAGICPNKIWVAAGEYFPDEGLTVTANDATESFYLIEGVKMYGGFDGVGPGGVGGTRELLLFQRNYDLNLTILSGDIEQNDIDLNGDGIIETPSDIVDTNSQHIVFVDASGLGTFTSSTALDGFRIAAGSDGAPGGSGLLCNGSVTNTCSPTLANLVFRGNEAAIGGGVANYYSSSTYTHVAFLSNEAQSVPGFGGAMYNYSSDLTMNDVQFTDNSADYGGALYNNASNPTITDAIFELNNADWSGGGIDNEDSNPTLIDITFVDNTAGLGGAMFNLDSGPTLLDVGFYGNSAAVGGAISNEIGGGLAAGTILPTSLTNTVFSGNTATDDGGAIYNLPNSSGGTLDIEIVNTTFSRNSAVDDGGSIYTAGPLYSGTFDINIANSIMWNSTDSTGFNEIVVVSGLVSIKFSDVRAILGAGVVQAGGVFTNLGNNRNTSPQFVDFDGPDALVGTLDDNLDLQAISLVIDKGRNNLTTEPLDFLGGTRKVDGDANGSVKVDMGAYEYQ